MRTTVDIDDDVLSAARSLARVQQRSLGSVLSHLARTGLADRVTIDEGGAFPVFDVHVGRPITSEQVRDALDDE